MKKIALFAIAALIGTASFAAPKVVKHTAKKAPVKTEAAATASVAKATTVKAPKTAKPVQDTTSKAKKVHKTKVVKKATKTTAAPKA